MTEPLSNEPKWLTTADIARLRKCSRWTALRWIRRVQKKTPESVKMRDGNLTVRRDVAARLIENPRLPPVPPEILDRLNALEDLARLIDRRTIVHGQALAKLHAI